MFRVNLNSFCSNGLNIWNIMKTSHFSFAILLCSLAAACTSGPQGVRVVNGGTSAISAKEGEKIRDFAPAEIVTAISGKTFQYTRSDGSGFVTYNADGTLSFQDDSKGEGTGRWMTNGNEYCETFGATAATECGVFKSTGDAYFAANSRLVEMKV
jgi:hypothetical protein